MNIKCCPRPSKETHSRQSEKTAFCVCGSSSGRTTHFQPKLFLSYGAANSKCVSRGSFTEPVEGLQSLSCCPQGCTSLKIPLCLLFPHAETNPREQFWGFLASQHALIKPPQWGNSPGSMEGQEQQQSKMYSPWLVQLSSPGTQLCLCEHLTVQHFKT